MHGIFENVAVVPVVTIEHIEDAVPLASALAAGGLHAIEVTFRTSAASAAITAIAREVPQAIVGAGTLLRPSDIAHAIEAGAKFLVSPGFSPDLAAAGLATELPYLPGVATPSEVMAARELGYSFLKFFPAAALGGPAALTQLAAVFNGVAFCPTGGLTQETAPSYLSLPNVAMVGGSWMAPKALVEARDWNRVRALAEAAARLKRS